MIRCVVALFLLLEAHAQPSERQDTIVRVAAWTTTGERLNKIWVTASALDGHEKHTGNGRDVDLALPTGEYVLQVEAPGFQTKSQLLKAYQPAVFCSFALPPAWIHGRTGSSVRGTVRDYEGNIRDLRVRLISLYGAELREAVLDSQSSFSFPVDEGAYLLLVIADLGKTLRVIDSRPLYIVGNEAITIDLKGKSGTILPLWNERDPIGAGRN